MENEKECLILKKATFYSDKIVIHKRKRDVIIFLKEIQKICYVEPSLWNYICAWSGSLFPQRLWIQLKNPPRGKRRVYLLKMKSNDYQRLPSAYWMYLRGDLY